MVSVLIDIIQYVIVVEQCSIVFQCVINISINEKLIAVKHCIISTSKRMMKLLKSVLLYDVKVDTTNVSMMLQTEQRICRE